MHNTLPPPLTRAELFSRYGQMDFNEPLLKAVIDSQPFQRLRNLKQLGLARQERERISIPPTAEINSTISPETAKTTQSTRTIVVL
jgi:hypothetical protein